MGDSSSFLETALLAGSAHPEYAVPAAIAVMLGILFICRRYFCKPTLTPEEREELALDEDYQRVLKIQSML